MHIQALEKQFEALHLHLKEVNHPSIENLELFMNFIIHYLHKKYLKIQEFKNFLEITSHAQQIEFLRWYLNFLLQTKELSQFENQEKNKYTDFYLVIMWTILLALLASFLALIVLHFLPLICLLVLIFSPLIVAPLCYNWLRIVLDNYFFNIFDNYINHLNQRHSF